MILASNPCDRDFVSFHLRGREVTRLESFSDAVFGFALTQLLYLHAWRLRDALELNDVERFDTRYLIVRLSTVAAIGVIAAALAWVPALRNWSSLIYFLLFPVLRVSRIVHRRRREAFLKE